MAKFVSKCLNQALSYKTGNPIQFHDGEYVTEDKSEIAAIRRNSIFGTGVIEIVEGDLSEESAETERVSRRRKGAEE